MIVAADRRKLGLCHGRAAAVTLSVELSATHFLEAQGLGDAAGPERDRDPP